MYLQELHKNYLISSSFDGFFVKTDCPNCDLIYGLRFAIENAFISGQPNLPRNEFQKVYPDSFK